MRVSNSAIEAAQRPRMVSFAELGSIFAENRLNPVDGRVAVVPGHKFVDLMRLGTLKDVEARINELLVEVRAAPTPHVRDARLGKAIESATNETDAYTLFYLTSMFIDQRPVMRKLATNPNIDARTQQILLTDPELKNDRAVQLALARNPSLTAENMRTLVSSSDDRFVHLAVALNAATRSQKLGRVSEFSMICDALAASAEPAVRQAAIGGMRDPDRLRQYAANNSVYLVPREIEAVARNACTPDDVLANLSKSALPAVQSLLAIRVAEYARSTLQSKRVAAAPDATPSPAY